MVIRNFNFFILIFFSYFAAFAQAVNCVDCPASEMKAVVPQQRDFANLSTKLKPNCKSTDNIATLKPIILENIESAPQSLTWAEYGKEFDNFMGIPAYSNKSIGGGTYQCTELVHRFMSGVFGVPTALGMGIGNGDQVAKGMSARFKDFVIQNKNTGNKKARLAHIENNCSAHAPVVGSLISIKYPNAGHVAIIREVKNIDDKTKEITLFEQHGIRRLNPGAKKVPTKMTITKNPDGTWGGSRIVGWISVVEI